MEDSNLIEKTPGFDIFQQSRFINIDLLLKEKDLESTAGLLLEDTLRDTDIMRKDSLDKFLDFIIFKIRTGIPFIINAAYPTKRMLDKEIEKKVMELINVHLYPEILLKLLKYLTRNLHDSDANLQLAYLITSDEIIRAIYDTFLLLKKDIYIMDPEKRSRNVKRIQQVSPRTDNKIASPLDASCRLKYILEFISLKQNVGHIYTGDDLLLGIRPEQK